MSLHACVKNNVVEKIIDVSSEEDYQHLASEYSTVIDISSIAPEPQVGWILSGASLVPAAPLPIEIIVQGKIKKAREFGYKLIAEATDRIGAKNILSGKTEAQVVEIVSLLLPIKQLLEGGALVTARTQLSLVMGSVDENIQAEISWAMDQITEYLGD